MYGFLSFHRNHDKDVFNLCHFLSLIFLYLGHWIAPFLFFIDHCVKSQRVKQFLIIDMLITIITERLNIVYRKLNVTKIAKIPTPIILAAQLSYSICLCIVENVWWVVWEFVTERHIHKWKIDGQDFSDVYFSKFVLYVLGVGVLYKGIPLQYRTTR